MRNLRNILTHPSLKHHAPKLLIVTPPPVCEHKMALFPEVARFPRRAENTRLYASAAKNVAKELEIPVIDLWTAFMNYARWREPDKRALVGGREAAMSELLGELLVDGMPRSFNSVEISLAQNANMGYNLLGLHLDSKGYQILYQEYQKTILEFMPEILAENLSPVIEKYPE